MNIKIVKDYRGIERIRRRLTELKKTTIEWGFMEEAKYGPENDNLQVAQVAFWQEYGTEHIPPRPFFITTVNANKKKYGKSIAKHIGLYLFKEKAKPRQTVFAVTATEAVEHLVFAIDEWDTPANSARWAAQKGFNDPLIHTGVMINSVTYNIKLK